jgi:hypothetical protein
MTFGCLASRAERFRKIIREQFVKMYEENDVLVQVLEQAKNNLAENAIRRAICRFKRIGGLLCERAGHAVQKGNATLLRRSPVWSRQPD